MIVRFSGLKVKSFLLRLVLLCLIFQTVSAFELSGDDVLKTENEARQLGRQWSGESVRRSVSLYTNASASREKLGDFRQSAKNLREAAKAAQLFSDYETSFALLNKALKIDEKINDTDGRIISLSLFSEVWLQKGDREKSEKYYRQAVGLSEKSTDVSAKANAFYSAGIFNTYHGDIKTTVEQLEKAISFAIQTEDTTLTAQIYCDLGAAYARDGQLEKLLDHANKSLEISVQTGNQREVALSRFWLGLYYLWNNKYQTALENLKIAEKDFPNDVDRLHKARIANSLAYIYEIYGEFTIAEKYRADAVELFEKAMYPTGVLATLPDLAKLKENRGDSPAAKALLEKALKFAVELKDEFQIGKIKEYAGDIALKNNLCDSAIENYRFALAVNQKIGIKLPRIENSLGKAFELKSDLKLAEKYYQKALDRNLEIKDYSPAAENLYNLAHLNVTSGEIGKVLEYSNRSIELSESTYTDVDNNKLRRTFLSNNYDRYSLNINLLMKMHERFPDQGYDRKALQIGEKSRSRQLLENLQFSEAEFMADADPQLVKKEKEILDSLNENAEKLTQSLTSNAAKTEIKKIEDEINESRNELEKIKGELRSKSPIYSTIKNPTDFDVQEFQENVLDDKSLFLEFSFGENESYLWLIGKTGFDVFTLPQREILEDQLNEIYDLLISRELLEDESIEAYRKRLSENERKFQEQAQVLSNYLFGKAAEKLKDKRLIIATDGKLRYFPVSALPFPNSDDEQINEPILLSNEVIYEPSATTLSLLTKKSKTVEIPEKDLLIFADAVYSAKDERIISDRSDLTRSSSNIDDEQKTSFLERLPATEQEAASIVKTFGSSDTKLFSGFSATRENFFETKLSDYKVLHFATHGTLNENQPEFSGLVFSQFGENGKRKKGIVRLQDIYGLNLAADLIVLSACDTGIGKDIKGEGLISLTDGFLQSGAKTVVSSRWKVSDKATLELMKNFYEIMEAENIPPSQALQKAKIKLRENSAFASPYHWAAFTIQGDYQNKPNFTGSFGFLKYLLILISIFVLLGIYFGIKKFR